MSNRQSSAAPGSSGGASGSGSTQSPRKPALATGDTSKRAGSLMVTLKQQGDSEPRASSPGPNAAKPPSAAEGSGKQQQQRKDDAGAALASDHGTGGRGSQKGGASSAAAAGAGVMKPPGKVGATMKKYLGFMMDPVWIAVILIGAVIVYLVMSNLKLAGLLRKLSAQVDYLKVTTGEFQEMINVAVERRLPLIAEQQQQQPFPLPQGPSQPSYYPQQPQHPHFLQQAQASQSQQSQGSSQQPMPQPLQDPQAQDYVQQQHQQPEGGRNSLPLHRPEPLQPPTRGIPAVLNHGEDDGTLLESHHQHQHLAAVGHPGAESGGDAGDGMMNLLQSMMAQSGQGDGSGQAGAATITELDQGDDLSQYPYQHHGLQAPQDIERSSAPLSGIEALSSTGCNGGDDGSAVCLIQT